MIYQFIIIAVFVQQCWTIDEFGEGVSNDNMNLDFPNFAEINLPIIMKTPKVSHLGPWDVVSKIPGLGTVIEWGEKVLNPVAIVENMLKSFPIPVLPEIPSISDVLNTLSNLNFSQLSSIFNLSTIDEIKKAIRNSPLSRLLESPAIDKILSSLQQLPFPQIDMLLGNPKLLEQFAKCIEITPEGIKHCAPTLLNLRAKRMVHADTESVKNAVDLVNN